MPIKGDGGRDIAMLRNPVTGKFDFDFDETNNPRFTDSDEHLVLSLLLEKQGKYGYGTARRGSKLHTVRNSTRQTPTQIEAFVRDALDPAVQDGRLRSLDSVQAIKRSAGRFDIAIQYKNRQGTVKSLRVPWSS